MTSSAFSSANLGVCTIRKYGICISSKGRTSFCKIEETKIRRREMRLYYPRFTKLVVNFVMEKDPSIPRRNKVNWHYARDDPLFTTINVISRNEALICCTGYLPVAIPTRTSATLNHTKSIMLWLQEQFLLRQKEARRKANTESITKSEASHCPPRKEMKELVLHQGFPMHLIMTQNDISWKSSDDDQDEEQAQDDEEQIKMTLMKTSG
ncbi:hypothetical protein Tco_1311930 [Tanacetum coccineum]